MTMSTVLTLNSAHGDTSSCLSFAVVLSCLLEIETVFDENYAVFQTCSWFELRWFCREKKLFAGDPDSSKKENFYLETQARWTLIVHPNLRCLRVQLCDFPLGVICTTWGENQSKEGIVSKNVLFVKRWSSDKQGFGVCVCACGIYVCVEGPAIFQVWVCVNAFVCLCESPNQIRPPVLYFFVWFSLLQFHKLYIHVSAVVKGAFNSSCCYWHSICHKLLHPDVLIQTQKTPAEGHLSCDDVAHKINTNFSQGKHVQKHLQNGWLPTLRKNTRTTQEMNFYTCAFWTCLTHILQDWCEYSANCLWRKSKNH